MVIVCVRADYIPRFWPLVSNLLSGQLLLVVWSRTPPALLIGCDGASVAMLHVRLTGSFEPGGGDVCVLYIHIVYVCVFKGTWLVLLVLKRSVC